MWTRVDFPQNSVESIISSNVPTSQQQQGTGSYEPLIQRLSSQVPAGKSPLESVPTDACV